MESKINYKPILYLLLLLIAVAISSCRKEELPSPENPVRTKDLKVNPTFDWKTSKDITLNVTGLKEINPETGNTLYIKSSKGETIYRDFLKMNTNYIIKFTVPSTETGVILVYGSITKSIALISGTITFNYIIEQ